MTAVAAKPQTGAIFNPTAMLVGIVLLLVLLGIGYYVSPTLGLMALIGISMDKHTPERFAHFEALVQDIPEVLECLLITGQQSDYQIKVVVRDMKDFQQLLLGKLTRIEGVTGVHTSFVLRPVFMRTSLPVD